MYQEKVLPNEMSNCIINNEFKHSDPWTYGITNRHDPSQMKVKEETHYQEVNYLGYNNNNNNNNISPTETYHCPPLQQYGPDGYCHGQNDMCHPLVINDYASNISSPDIAYGPSLSPDIMSSSSTTSPTTTDDSWFDVCSPSLQHLTPSSYSMEQRHSFDNAMIFTKTDYGVNECCAYTCNNYTGGSRMMDPANPIHLIHPSLTSWYQPYHHQQQSMITTRHQSMPSIYQQQHDSPHSSPSDIRPYQCQICERSFARKHDLQRHIRVHTGDKPYACLCCKKAFARTDALKRHLRMEDNCRTSPQIQAMKSSGKRRYKNL